MAETADEPSAQAARNRVQPFLDCVAYLLAKRWLQDQRQAAAQSPQETSEHHDEPSAP